MKLQHILIAVSLVTVALVPAGALATHEDTDCEVTSSEPTVEAEGLAIFVDEVASEDYLFSIWIYEETNGIDGIQRGDSYAADEDCGHGSDTIVF